MAAGCDCGFELVDHPPHSDLAPSDYFLFPTWKQQTNTWLGSSIRLMMRSDQQFRTFPRIRMRASIPRESKHCNTDGRNVWMQGRLCWKINHICCGQFNHCIIVSLWTFQPTYVQVILQFGNNLQNFIFSLHSMWWYSWFFWHNTCLFFQNMIIWVNLIWISCLIMWHWGMQLLK